MNGFKKPLLLGLGYLGFFLVSLVVFTYLTFDPGIFAPKVVEGLQRSWPPLEDKKITIEQIKRHRLFSLDLRNITIEVPAPTPDQPAKALVVDRLILSPRLLSLPGLVRSIKNGETPEIALSSYTLNLADGKIKGKLEMGRRRFVFTAEVKDPVVLGKLTIPSERFKDLKLEGKLSGEMAYEVPDLKDPASLRGDIKIELDQLVVKDLKMAGLDELAMDQGTLIARMEGTQISIETLKLQGQDIPLSLQGTINLNNPWRSSLIDVKGSISPGQSFKDKNPLAGSFVPDNKNFAFSGTVESLMPGMF